jgi:outer membrane immunogenic protein
MRRYTVAALAGAAMSVGLVQGATAADLGRRPAPAPVAVAPIYNWTGVYVGVHAGWIWSEGDAAVSSTGLAPATALAPFGYSFDGDGGMLGGQIGFNYQFSNIVVGIEADLSWTGVDGGATVAPLTFGAGVIPGSFHTSSFDMNWFGTVRGRLGFAANNLLIYVTGGLAFGDVDATTVTQSFIPGIGLNTWTGSASDTQVGWTIGGGLEWGFAPNWSIKGEYLYYDLGDTTVVATGGVAPSTIVTNFDNTGHILRVGLNYRFGGGPVVARY